MAGLYNKVYGKATFSFGAPNITTAATTYAADYVPQGYRVTKVWYEVTTALAGAGNLSFGYADDTAAFKAATAYNDASFTVDTPTIGIIDGTPATYETVVAADKKLSCINSGTMTSGVIVVHAEIEPKL